MFESLETRCLPGFLAPLASDAGSSPTAVAVGDFNHDGIQDLVAANGSPSYGVSVLLGNGDGSFRAPTHYALGGSPKSVAVADFNGDGIQDLAVATSRGVSELLGNGDGSFSAATDYIVGSDPESVAVADLNGDGRLDLVVANAGSGNVSLLLGNGDGSFQTARTFAAGSSPYSVAVGDVNGDGLPDLAVADLGVFGQNSVVSVLLGNGDGSFQPAQIFSAGPSPRFVAGGDFNGDGVSDLAVANDVFLNGTVSVLLGNGDGSFQTARTFAAGHLPDSVTVGDFNGDGLPDLAVADAGEGVGNGSGVSVLLGNGDGSFTGATVYAVGNRTTAVAVGDVNGDGAPDLISANMGGYHDDNDISVLLGRGDGSFETAGFFETGFGTIGGNPTSVVVGDVNGDGILDLAVGHDMYYYGDGCVGVLLGNGDGTFRAAGCVDAGGGPRSVALGDFNGDGILDLAVADIGSFDGGSPAGVKVLLGNRDGSYRLARNLPTLGDSVTVGDFNGDGLLDLAVASENRDVVVFLGNGDGTFQAARSLKGVTNHFVTVADLNGDGIPDLITSGVVLLSNGDGTFQAPPEFPRG